LASEAQAIGGAPEEQAEVVNKLADNAHVDYDIGAQQRAVNRRSPEATAKNIP
jgi:hypothetical protein